MCAKEQLNLSFHFFYPLVFLSFFFLAAFNFSLKKKMDIVHTVHSSSGPAQVVNAFMVFSVKALAIETPQTLDCSRKFRQL